MLQGSPKSRPKDPILVVNAVFCSRVIFNVAISSPGRITKRIPRKIKLHRGMRYLGYLRTSRWSLDVFVSGYKHRLDHHTVDNAFFVPPHIRITRRDWGIAEWGGSGARGGSRCEYRRSLIGRLLLFFHGQGVLEELLDLLYAFSLLSSPPDEDCGRDTAKEARGYQDTGRPRRAVKPRNSQVKSSMRSYGYTTTAPVEAPHGSTQNDLKDRVAVDKPAYNQGGTVK